MNFTDLIQGMGPGLLYAVRQSVPWRIMVLGVYITFKLLDIVDLTVGGSFALGGYVCATLIVGRGMNPVVTLFTVALAGMATGLVIGISHAVFEISSILAGILTRISLWSIDLWIMGGSSNVPLLKSKSIMTTVFSAAGFNQVQTSQIAGTTAAIFMTVVMYWSFGTKIGSAPRIIENNKDTIHTLGVNTKWTRLLVLMLNSGLVDVPDALMCQGQEYADIQMSTETIIIELAAIIIGEVLFGQFHNFALKLSAAVIGSVIYFVTRASVIKMGINPNYMKLLSAIVVTLALCIPVATNKWKIYKEHSKGGGVQR